MAQGAQGSDSEAFGGTPTDLAKFARVIPKTRSNGSFG